MTFALSAYYIPLCLLAGALYAVLLYWGDRKSDFAPRIRNGAALLRFLVVSLLCFLLLSPMIRSGHKVKERPVVVIAQDNSTSMVSGNDSAQVRQQIPAKVEELAGKLSGDYDVQIVNFGSSVREGVAKNFSDEATDYSTLFGNLKDRLVNRRQSTVVLFSDGSVNRGGDPLFATTDARFTIFTVACGDTIPRRDLMIRSLRSNKVAFTGSSLPVEVIVNATALNGNAGKLSLSIEGEKTFEQDVPIRGNNFSKSVIFNITPSKPGLIRVQAMLSVVDGEFTKVNNQMTTYIEVLDSRRRILLLGASPHPDLGALRQILHTNDQFEVELTTPPQALPDPSLYNLIIYHQLPSATYPLTDYIGKAQQLGIPALFIIGNLTSLTLYNNLLPPVTIQSGGSFVDASATFLAGFSLFVTPPQADAMFRNLPPFSVPFGEYRTATGTDVMMTQSINGLRTERPLVAFGRMGNHARCGVITGEGLWQQHLTQQMLTGDAAPYDSWVMKTVQYLAMREPKTRLTVNAERSFHQFEPVVFEATLLNKTYEMINDPDLSLVISNEDGQTFPFQFARHQKGYLLNAGHFPSGRYNWHASVNNPGDPLTASGVFVVAPANLEQQSSTANHQLLAHLAAEHGGEMVSPEETNRLADLLLNGQKMKPVIYTEEHISDLISLPAIFIIVVLLLAFEWVIRRWAGSY